MPNLMRTNSAKQYDSGGASGSNSVVTVCNLHHDAPTEYHLMRVRSLRDAQACLESSIALGLPLCVISPPQIGGLFWMALWQEAFHNFGHDAGTQQTDDNVPCDHTDITGLPNGSLIALDCGSSSGDAIAGLRAGVRDIVITPEPSLLPSLTHLATAHSARIWHHMVAEEKPSC